MSSDGQSVLIFLAIAFALYFFPSLVAYHRRKVDATGVVVLNLFLGWTLIGWVVALAWAASGATRPITTDALGRDFSTTKVCPRCAEQVQKAAMACRYCSYEFAAATTPARS